jgi:hypothetical protein
VCEQVGKAVQKAGVLLRRRHRGFIIRGCLAQVSKFVKATNCCIARRRSVQGCLPFTAEPKDIHQHHSGRCPRIEKPTTNHPPDPGRTGVGVYPWGPHSQDVQTTCMEFFAYMQAAHEAQVEESAQRSKLSPSSGPKEITRPGAPYPRKPWTRACFALGIHGTWYSRDLVFHRLSIFRLRVTPWLLSTDRRLGQTSSRSCVRWCGTEELGQVRR